MARFCGDHRHRFIPMLPSYIPKRLAPSICSFSVAHDHGSRDILPAISIGTESSSWLLFAPYEWPVEHFHGRMMNRYEDGERFLITRLSHIGDCILTLPLACALKQSFPKCHVSWVVERPTDSLLRDHSAIDELIVLPRGWRQSLPKLAKVRSQLRSLRPTVVFDPQSLTKSALLAWLSGARTRIGFRGRFGRELAPLLNNEFVQPKSTHLLDRTLELLQPLQPDTPSPIFDLQVSATAQSSMKEFLKTHHLGCRFALINPGGSWPSKRWSPRKFGRVAAYLGEAHEVPSVVVWAGDEERTWAETIVKGSRGRAVLAPKTDLRELAALSALAAFFVGGDTGPMHIAAAMGTPCIGLYGPTKPQDSGAYGPATLIGPGVLPKRKSTPATQFDDRDQRH